jgi:hypothetical protein
MKKLLFPLILLFGCSASPQNSNQTIPDVKQCADAGSYEHCIEMSGSLEKGFVITNTWNYKTPLNNPAFESPISSAVWQFNLICSPEETIKNYSAPTFLYFYDSNNQEVKATEEQFNNMIQGLYENAIPKMASRICTGS